MAQGFTEGCEIDACPLGCSGPQVSVLAKCQARVQEVAATEWLGTLNILAPRTMSQDSERGRSAMRVTRDPVCEAVREGELGLRCSVCKASTLSSRPVRRAEPETREQRIPEQSGFPATTSCARKQLALK